MTENRVPTHILKCTMHDECDLDLQSLVAEQPAPPPTVHRADCPLFAESIEHEGFCPTDPQWRIRVMTEDRVPTPEPHTEAACPECGHDVDHTTACPDGCPLCLTSPRARLADKLREMYGPSLRPDDPDHDGSLTDWLRDAFALVEAAQGAAPLDVERLARALEASGVSYEQPPMQDAERVAAEYARLGSAPSPPLDVERRGYVEDPTAEHGPDWVTERPIDVADIIEKAKDWRYSDEWIGNALRARLGSAPSRSEPEEVNDD